MLLYFQLHSPYIHYSYRLYTMLHYSCILGEAAYILCNDTPILTYIIQEYIIQDYIRVY